MRRRFRSVGSSAALVLCVVQIADYFFCCWSFFRPLRGLDLTAFTRVPQACAWGYHPAPASRALRLVLA